MSRGAALAAAALALFGVAWVWGNPPSGAPDELTHYVKAVGVAGGDLNGRAVHHGLESESDYAKLQQLIRAQGGKPATPSAAEVRRSNWMRSQTRDFDVPAKLAVETLCNSRGSARTACLDHLVPSRPLAHQTTPMGTYQPLPYLVPGLAARTAGNPLSAIHRARLVSALLCLGLIGLAAAVIARGPGGLLALLGLVVALSPAVLLLGVTINPSGSEVAGTIAFAAGLFSIARPGGRWWAAWLAVGAGGVALAGSKSFGPAFVVLVLATVAALVGRAGVSRAVAPPRRSAAVCAGLIAVAAAFNWAWELSEQPHPHAGRGDVGPGLHNAVHGLSGLAKQVVGEFGTALDVPLSAFAYALWAALLAGVVGLALRFGSGRERAVLAAVFAAAFVGVALLAIAVRPTGFPVQTRHLMPIVVLFGLCAGEVLRGHASRFRPGFVRGAFVATVAGAALVHLDAWRVNSRAWSGWTPPGGAWWIWTTLLCAAAAAYVAAAYYARA